MNFLMIAGGNDRIFIFLALHLLIIARETLSVFNISLNINTNTKYTVNLVNNICFTLKSQFVQENGEIITYVYLSGNKSKRLVDVINLTKMNGTNVNKF